MDLRNRLVKEMNRAGLLIPAQCKFFFVFQGYCFNQVAFFVHVEFDQGNFVLFTVDQVHSCASDPIVYFAIVMTRISYLFEQNPELILACSSTTMALCHAPVKSIRTESAPIPYVTCQQVNQWPRTSLHQSFSQVSVPPKLISK